MRYLAIISLFIFIMFVASFLITGNMKKEEGFSKKLKFTGLMMLVTLPIISLVGGCLFLAFKLVEMLLPVRIATFDIFTIAILGVFIIFICDLLSKQIMSSIIPHIFAKKYEGKDLTKDDMINIIDGARSKFDIITLCIMFGISIILYILIVKIIEVEFSLIFIFIISLLNIISYKVFFRNKIVE